MPPANMYGITGRHDFIICQRGLYWTIEAKAGLNKPTENQITFAENIKAAGGMSILVNEHTLDLVDRIAGAIDISHTLPTPFASDFTAFRK